MPMPKIALPPNGVLLFQGDSVTDAGRNRAESRENDATALGSGYAGRIAGQLLAEHPGSAWRTYNRGLSGDRSVDLLVRWRRDALALKPDVISILVGVNDTWHRYMGDAGIEVERYAQFYRMILNDTRTALPKVGFVLGEPFALSGGVFQTAWMDELRARSAVVQKLARETDAVFVPYQAMFDAAQRKYAAVDLASDGVHPTALGHELMAHAWREAVGL